MNNWNAASIDPPMVEGYFGFRWSEGLLLEDINSARFLGYAVWSPDTGTFYRSTLDDRTLDDICYWQEAP